MGQKQARWWACESCDAELLKAVALVWMMVDEDREREFRVNEGKLPVGFDGVS